MISPLGKLDSARAEMADPRDKVNPPLVYSAPPRGKMPPPWAETVSPLGKMISPLAEVISPLAEGEKSHGCSNSPYAETASLGRFRRADMGMSAYGVRKVSYSCLLLKCIMS